MKWTPGPWEAIGLHLAGCGDISIEAHSSTNASGYIPVARAYGQGYLVRDQELIGRRNANARLIAAAPDLVATLRAMLDFYAPDCEGDCKVPEHGPAGVARALLARIEGRAK